MQFLRRHLVFLVLASYACAAYWPDAGQWLRSTTLTHLVWGQQSVTLTVPAALLALLLFSSALGIELGELQTLWQRRGVTLGSVLGAIALPVVAAWPVAAVVKAVGPSGRADGMILGLALVAVMPTAASSTAWAQSGEGNGALSLAQVLASTALSPILTPALLMLFAPLISGRPALRLQGLQEAHTPLFMAVVVFLPLGLGLLLRWLGFQAPPWRKPFNLACLLLLNYISGTMAMPKVLQHASALLWVLPVVLAHNLLTLHGARHLARLVGAWPKERLSLVLGCGMRNTGAALVLMVTLMPDTVQAVMVVVGCGLMQEVAASLLTRLHAPPSSTDAMPAWQPTRTT